MSYLSRLEKASQHKESSEFVLAFYRTVLERNTMVQSVNVALSAYSDEISNATHRYIVVSFPNGRTLRVTQASVDNGDVYVQLEEERR